MSTLAGVDSTDGRDQQAVLRPRAEVVDVRSSTEDNGEGCPPTSILLRADPRRDIMKPHKQCFIQVTGPLLFLLLHFGFSCSDRSPSSSLPSLYNCVHIAALLASFHPSFCRRLSPHARSSIFKGSPSFNFRFPRVSSSLSFPNAMYNHHAMLPARSSCLHAYVIHHTVP